MEWNEEAIARLRSLWAEGLSTAEIGRRLNVSKNAVVGKAHRLNLPPRPSPIRRAPEGAAVPAPRPKPVPAAEPTLPLLAPVPPPSVAALVPAMEDVPLPRPAPVPRPALRPVPSASAGRVSECCWPIGEPGTKGFRFCDAASTPGKPYCQEHAAIAYVKVRDRRDEAA